MLAWAQLPTPERTLSVQLPKNSSASQMENFLSLLESVDPPWLTPSSTTWTMDVIFAFVCGLGLFYLLSPLLHLGSLSPPPAENTTIKRVPGSCQNLVHSNLSHGESLQEDLSLTIQEASSWTGPTYRQIEAGEPSFINPDIQQMLEVQIRKRVEVKVWKGQRKERSDHALGCMNHMPQSWSRKQATTASHPFWSRNCQSEQFTGHQQFFNRAVLANELKDKRSQVFWNLPFLHNESLVATVNMAGSPLDSPSILSNGLSTYIPVEVRANIPPQLFPPKSLLRQSVKFQPLTERLSLSQSPPMAGIQTQTRDPSSLHKLPHHSAPMISLTLSNGRSWKNIRKRGPHISRVNGPSSPSSRDARELEATEEESRECTLPVESGEMSKSQNSEWLETISQDPEDSGLSTSHCLAACVVLQDCASVVGSAAVILASRVSWSSFKTIPATTKSPFQDRYPFLSKEGNVPTI
ncbi:hypothetical protein ACRRTK_020132 [Alexandromys fortis]